jgi:hypothetical protein
VLKFNESNAECAVFTYKQGMLSAVAHNLKLEVSKFEITVQMNDRDNDPSEREIFIDAVFDASSLKAVCTMKDGEEQAGTLSSSDRKDIEKNIADSVLLPKKYPQIRFSSTSVSGDLKNPKVEGKLTLCGVTRDLVVSVMRQNSGYAGEVTLKQPDFGIKPFSALLGTMKVKPAVVVRVSVKCLAEESE